jgi:hypothetical protein
MPGRVGTARGLQIPFGGSCVSQQRAPAADVSSPGYKRPLSWSPACWRLLPPGSLHIDTLTAPCLLLQGGVAAWCGGGELEGRAWAGCGCSKRSVFVHGCSDLRSPPTSQGV